MKLSEKIVALRESKNISQTDFARKVGINRSVINRIEKGTRPVRDDELKTIADFFNVSVDYLLGNDSKSEILSPSERDLIHRYRSLDDKKQASLFNYISFLQVAI